MASSVILVGGNLVSDTAFRKRLAGRDTGVELQMVVEDLLPSWRVEQAEQSGSVTVEKADTIMTGPPQPEQYLPRLDQQIYFYDNFCEHL